jgi:hypothetical protein
LDGQAIEGAMKQRFALVAALLLLASACADLAAVQDYARALAMTQAVKSIVDGLKISQARLKGLIDEAMDRIAAIESAARFIDLLVDGLAFAAAAITGKPDIIFAAALEIGKDVGLETD